MRRLRFPLAVLVALIIVFDIQEAFRIYTYGWPPDESLDFSETGGILMQTVTTKDRAVYGLILLGIALVQGVLVRLAWKAWRPHS